MSRLEAAFFATISLAAWTCFGQAPDVFGANPNQEDLERLLASGPREVAWAAYTIGTQNRREMVPSLAALVGSYQGAPIPDRGPMPPEAAAIEAVADALIRLQATLPADTVMRLYPQFPAQTIILLSRASENTAALLEIFQTTQSRDLWLAAGNLLALRPTPEFVHSLLSGFVASFTFHVVPPSSDAWGSGASSGCAGDFLMSHDTAFGDWPKARMYRLITGRRPQNVFAPGIHPIGFSTWETNDYRDPWTDISDCSPEKSRDWRTGLLAQLQGKNLSDFPLKPQTREIVRYSSAASFESEVQAAIEKQSTALRGVAASFVESGLMPIGDAGVFYLQCRIQVQDDRPGPRSELPQVEGKWCTPAPTEELAQNGVRRDWFLDWFGGARRTLCAPKAEGLGPPE
jgi:hypothetical protein